MRFICTLLRVGYGIYALLPVSIGEKSFICAFACDRSVFRSFLSVLFWIVNILGFVWLSILWVHKIDILQILS